MTFEILFVHLNGVVMKYYKELINKNYIYIKLTILLIVNIILLQ